MSDASQRIEDLEIKVAYLEKQLHELDDVVREQAELIAQLRRQLDVITAKVEQDGLATTEPERPPHY